MNATRNTVQVIVQQLNDQAATVHRYLDMCDGRVTGSIKKADARPVGLAGQIDRILLRESCCCEQCIARFVTSASFVEISETNRISFLS